MTEALIVLQNAIIIVSIDIALHGREGSFAQYLKPLVAFFFQLRHGYLPLTDITPTKKI